MSFARMTAEQAQRYKQWLESRLLASNVGKIHEPSHRVARPQVTNPDGQGNRDLHRRMDFHESP